MERREKVRNVFSDVADHPEGNHPYVTGQSLAEKLGYPSSFLANLPDNTVDRFSGVSAVSSWADLPVEGTVLEVGSGAGLDSLLAAKKNAARGGKVTGIDFSESMVREAHKAADQMSLTNVNFIEAPAENLPFDSGTFDAVMANGIFNLNPKREDIFNEIARVLDKNGTFWGAELILTEPLSQEEKDNPNNWFR